MMLVVAAIVASGVWIYNASATTFTLQNDIRIAQNTRDQIVRLHLADKSDVQAFAATNDASFIRRYDRQKRDFLRSTALLKLELPTIDPHYDITPIQREEAIFASWQREVAVPIFKHRRRSMRRLLVVIDPELSKKFLDEDAKIQNFLENYVLIAEAHRKTLLQRLIFVRIISIIGGIALVGALIWSRERAERRRLVHAAEAEEQQRIAEMFQKSLVPDTLPEALGVKLQAVYFPAALQHAVGGDWYEVIELSQGRLLCIIGDVAGHGLDAAIIMNRARQSIITAAITEENPARILQRANQMLVKLSGRIVSVLCCILDTGTGHFQYASAGHPPPVVVPPNAPASLLSYGGPPLGIFPELDLCAHTCTLEKGSNVYLFTDGLIENDRDIISGEAHVLEGAAFACSSLTPASVLFEHVIASGEPRDDVAIVSIRFS